MPGTLVSFRPPDPHLKAAKAGLVAKIPMMITLAAAGVLTEK
jgi:hypothetical protein